MAKVFDPLAEGAVIRKKEFNPTEEGASFRGQSSNPMEQPAYNNAGTVDTFLGKMPKNPPTLFNTLKNTKEKENFQEDLKKSLNIASVALFPELRLPAMLASKLPGLFSGAINLAGRIGTNTALGGALHEFNSNEKPSLEGFKQGAEEALPYAVGGEALTIPFRGARYLAELINPKKYATTKLSDIKNAYESAVGKQKEAYRPVMEKHGETPLTNSVNGDITLYHGTPTDSAERILKEGLRSPKYSQDYALLTNKPSAALAYSARRNGEDEVGDLLKINIPKSKLSEYIHPENKNWSTQDLKPRGERDSQIFGTKKHIPSKYISKADDTDFLLKPNDISTEINNIHPSEYFGFDKKTLRRFTPDVDKSYKDFLESPTFGNAHNFQSQLFRDLSSINKKNKPNTYQALRNARKLVNNKIENFLSADPKSLKNYILGTEITKNEVSPFHSNLYLRQVLADKIKSAEPRELQSAIKKGAKMLSGGIPEKHYLQEELKKLDNRINVGNLVGTGLPAITSALMAHPLFGSTGAGVAGLAGAGAGFFGSHGAAKLAQNPALVKMIEGLYKPYSTGVRGAIGYNVNNQ